MAYFLCLSIVKYCEMFVVSEIDFHIKQSRLRNTHKRLCYPIFYGAVNQSRTDDLILTKDVLYQLSYNSINVITFILYHTRLVLSSTFYKSFTK